MAIFASAALTACGAEEKGQSTGSAKVVDIAIPKSGCGSIALGLPKDPDGVLAKLPKSSRDGYLGYVQPKVTKSLWADFKPNHPPPYKVGLAFGPVVPGFQVSVYEAIKKDLESNPDIELKAVSTGLTINIPQQFQQYQALVNENPDLMIVQPLADAFGPLIDKAGKKGIPTLSIQGISSSKYAINMGANNYGSGAQATSYAVRAIGGKGNLVNMHGIASSPSDQETTAAVNKVLKACPNVKLAGELSGAFVSPTAKSEMLRYLATHPEKIDAVLNTGVMAPGIMSAFTQAGRPMPLVVDRGTMKASMGYWINNRDEYKGFAQGAGASGFGRAIASVAKRILAGRGVQVSDITDWYEAVTEAELDKWAKSEWDATTPGISEGPPRTPEFFMSDEIISSMFRDPAPADTFGKR